MMTIQEAMQQRHTVRKYADHPLAAETVKMLEERMAINNEKYTLSIKLMLNNSNALTPLMKAVLAKGVKNYFILSGTDTPELDERLGYCGADLMLYAQTVGLNTWWVGSTFNRKAAAAVAEGKKVIGILAVGYGLTQGAPHKSKMPDEVSSYDGAAPDWFTNGVNAALLAPTALNKQAFMISGTENKVTVSCGSDAHAKTNRGIIKYHFELGAGKDNFEWSE